MKTARVAHQLILVTLAVMDSPYFKENADVLDSCQKTESVLVASLTSILRNKRLVNIAALKLLIASSVKM